MNDKTYPHLLRRADIEQAQGTFSHPWNPRSQITGTALGRLAGLTRTGVSLARIAPGKESFIYHLHHREEEWVYILSGRARMDIDGVDHELAAGDFVAFPTPSAAHHMVNPYDEDVVYLMGGEHLDHEVADFPRLGLRKVRLGEETAVYRLADGGAVPDPAPD